MRKKAAAIVLAVALCMGFVNQNVDAASCTSHDWKIIGIAGEYTSGSDHHKVYRNLFVDGQQVYSYCTITYKTTLYNVRCMKCGESTTQSEITASHSLANDPDHR